MNYKDPDNILLILCGSMGIAGLALFFRYVFISMGFDYFGANTVFVIVFVIGVIVFINYLELILHITAKLFKKKPEIEFPAEKEPEESFEIKQDLESVREEYRKKEQRLNDNLLETAIQYTRTIFAPYASDDNIDVICQAVTDYLHGIDIHISKPVSVTKLGNGDLFHYGWNIWNHFKPVKKNKQEDIAYFLKTLFAQPLKKVEVATIRKKLTFSEGKYKIKIENALRL